MSKEICQRCQEKDYDRRTLWMACFYEMKELGLPLEERELECGEDKHRFYLLRVCKDCRGDWLGAIKKWFGERPVRESCGSGIFVRRNGATVEITEEEWNEENPGREAVRFKP